MNNKSQEVHKLFRENKLYISDDKTIFIEFKAEVIKDFYIITNNFNLI